MLNKNNILAHFATETSNGEIVVEIWIQMFFNVLKEVIIHPVGYDMANGIWLWHGKSNLELNLSFNEFFFFFANNRHKWIFPSVLFIFCNFTYHGRMYTKKKRLSPQFIFWMWRTLVGQPINRSVYNQIWHAVPEWTQRLINSILSTKTINLIRNAEFMTKSCIWM